MSTIAYFRSPAYRGRVNDLLHKFRCPGIAVAVYHDDAWASAGFGKAVLGEAGEADQDCTEDTLFDIASSSKSLTAAAVALLVDDDSLPAVQWDAKMADLLPGEFVMSEDEYTKGIMVEDILSHRTGLPSHDSSYLGIKAAKPDDARSVTLNLRSLPVAAPIRAKWMYCNLMFTVATYLVEVLAQQTFSQFLHSRFFTPLKMTSTSLQPDEARQKGFTDRMAMGYEWSEEKQTYIAIPILQSPEDQGAGSIITSAKDYLLYVKALMKREAPFTQLMRDELIKPRFVLDEAEEPRPRTSINMYALGWEVYFYRGYKVVQHDGGITGFGSRHLFLPQLNFAAVLLANSGDGGNSVASVLASELIDELLKVPREEKPDWTAIEEKSCSEYDIKQAGRLEEVRQELCPGIGESNQKLDLPLASFIGTFHNAGYHDMKVVIKDDALFVDATDRSMGFYLRFEHVCDNRKFVAHLIDVDDGLEDPLRAEFELDAIGRIALRMGLHIESDLDDYVWFDRV